MKSITTRWVAAMVIPSSTWSGLAMAHSKEAHAA